MKVRVGDLMTRKAISVRDDAGFKDMVQMMGGARISALPVVDGDGRVVGVVSEADLLLKEELEVGDTPRFFETRDRRETRRKAQGELARDVMSSPAITTTPDVPVVEAARVMHRRRVKRLPVVDEQGRLVGILSRADVLRVFMRTDEEIRREIVDDVIVRTLWLDPQPVHVAVEDGIVDLRGQVDRRSDREALAALCAGVTGVVSVRADALGFRFDDVRGAAAAAR